MWVDNATDSDVLVRYEQSAGNEVYEVPAGRSGDIGSFPPSEENRLVILSPDCAPKLESSDIPPFDPVLVRIGATNVTASPIATPDPIDPPAFTEVARCGSFRES